MNFIYFVSITAALIGGGLIMAMRHSQTSKGSVYVKNGILYAPGGINYRITDTDLLWLGRALIGEVGESGWTSAGKQRGGAAVIWALAQNFTLLGANPPRYSSLSALARAYCQPINPLWAVPNSGKCLSRPDMCQPNHVQRRARITSTSWESLPEEVKDLLRKFQSGSLRNPVVGLTDWKNSPWDNAIEIEGNYFGRR